jgi:lipopolysaccharide transport system permease protein
MTEAVLADGVRQRRPASKRRWARAGADLAQTLSGWRLWTTLGANDIAQRYRRSRLGQFWITASMAVFIAAIGSVYALLFRMNLRDQLPHVVIYYTAWSFMSSCVNEGAGAFIDAERYLRQEQLPKLTFVLRVVWRNLLAYLHNLVLVPIALLVFGLAVTPAAFEALAGVAFMLVNVTLAVVIVSMLCTRFRDLRQLVQSVVQIAFLTSPVMWRPDTMPARARALVDFNPIAAHLRLIGEPLLGGQPSPMLYAMCGGVTAVLLLIAIPLFVRFRERLVYWL